MVVLEQEREEEIDLCACDGCDQPCMPLYGICVTHWRAGRDAFVARQNENDRLEAERREAALEDSRMEARAEALEELAHELPESEVEEAPAERELAVV